MSGRTFPSWLLAASLLVASGCNGSGTLPRARGDEAEQDLEVLRAAASRRWEKGEYEEAAHQYEIILDRAPDDPEATLGLGYAYAQLGDKRPGLFEKGEELLRKYNDHLARPGDGRGYLGLGILFFRMGNQSISALNLARESRQAAEDDLASISSRMQVATGGAERARLARELRNRHRRVQELDEMVTRAEERRDRAFKDADLYFTTAIEKEPVLMLAYNFRAETRSLTGRYSEALDDLDLYIDQVVTENRRKLQELLVSTEDSQQVAEIQERLDRVDTAEAVLLEHRASLLRRLGRPGEAVDDLVRVIELAPDRVTAYREIGSLYEKQGSYDEAIIWYERFIDNLPLNQVDARAEMRARINELAARVTGRDEEQP